MDKILARDAEIGKEYNTIRGNRVSILKNLHSEIEVRVIKNGSVQKIPGDMFLLPAKDEQMPDTNRCTDDSNKVNNEKENTIKKRSRRSIIVSLLKDKLPLKEIVNAVKQEHPKAIEKKLIAQIRINSSILKIPIVTE